MKKFLIGAAVLAMAAAPIAASAAPFGGHGFGGRGAYGAPRYYHGGNGGAAVAAGLFGFILGAAIADGHPAYDYAPPYAVRCDWETRAYPGPWGAVHYEQVQVCR